MIKVMENETKNPQTENQSEQVEYSRLPSVPSPEVVAKPTRRTFTAEDKARILAEADQCDRGELGALCRREGIYRKTISKCRKQRDKALEEWLGPQKPGPKPQEHNPLEERVAALEKENARLRKRLMQAETIIEVQKKSPRC